MMRVFVLVLFVPIVVQGFRVKRADGHVDFARLCNATWSFNAEDSLNECNEEKLCADGFECSKEGGVCCPTRDHVCSLPIESGHELRDFEHVGRFGFDRQLRTCIKFSYFGSGGNLNRFATFAACRRFCAPPTSDAV
ncbi:hypothetical protein M3Y99_01420200 [Aphelenchoides fujianensis]|nr:hypothetical protein M3Y99_01420200 [Aphelenchoides fujianensis]